MVGNNFLVSSTHSISLGELFEEILTPLKENFLKKLFSTYKKLFSTYPSTCTLIEFQLNDTRLKLGGSIENTTGATYIQFLLQSVFTM
jgi:hypothetical protein